MTFYSPSDKQKQHGSASENFQKIGGNPYILLTVGIFGLEICWRKAFNFVHVCSPYSDMGILPLLSFFYFYFLLLILEWKSLKKNI
jgi:hypothetical protein